MNNLFKLVLVCTFTIFSTSLFAQSSGAKAPTWGDTYIEETPEEELNIVEEETIDLTTPQIATEEEAPLATSFVTSSRKRVQKIENNKLKKAVRKLDRPDKKATDTSNFLLLGLLAIVLSVLFLILFWPLGALLLLIGFVLIIWWIVDKAS